MVEVEASVAGGRGHVQSLAETLQTMQIDLKMAALAIQLADPNSLFSHAVGVGQLETSSR